MNFFALLWFVPGSIRSPELMSFFHLDGRVGAKKSGESEQEGEEAKTEGELKQEIPRGIPRQVTASQYEVSVASSRTVSRTGYPHVTYYTVRSASLDPQYSDVQVERRFDDFKSLNHAVRSNYASGRSSHLAQNIPVFPVSAIKIFTNHADPGFVEGRRQALERYLRELVTVPHANSDIHLLYFLGVWTYFRPVVGGILG